MKFKVNISILLLLLVSACSQPPARIIMKGQQNYTRGTQTIYGQSNHNHSKPSSNSSSSSYGSNSNYKPKSTSYSNSRYNNAPIIENTSQDASVSSIGISDLPPPDSSKKIYSDDETRPVELKPYSPPTKGTGYKRKKSIKTRNPWTNKPRSAIEPKNKKKHTTAKKRKITTKHTHRLTASRSKRISGLKWPVRGGRVISSFGSKGGGKVNDGINIAVAKNSPVWSSANGKVVYVSNNLKGYGNMVLINHAGRKTTTYAHLNRSIVRKHQKVKRGEVIGYVGSTGSVRKPQLFFSLYKGTKAVNPRKYMSRKLAGL